MAPLAWLVTGATSGLGKALVSRIIAKGDKVVATGRRAEERLASTKWLENDESKNSSVAIVDLDVSAPRETIEAQVKKAWEVFGHVDVLVNNAGLSAPKSIEEASDQFMHDILEVNVFGPIRVTQSILPYLRKLSGEQKTKTMIAFIGAGVSWGRIPFLAHYSAAKAALNSYVEGLRKELRGSSQTDDTKVRIECTVFELGGFASRLGLPREGSDEGFGVSKPSIEVYNELFAETMSIFMNEIGPNIPGNVTRMAKAIVDLTAENGLTGNLPVRVVPGSDAVAVVKQKCKEQMELVDQFEHVSKRSDWDNTENLDYSATLKLTSMLP